MTTRKRKGGAPRGPKKTIHEVMVATGLSREEAALLLRVEAGDTQGDTPMLAARKRPRRRAAS